MNAKKRKVSFVDRIFLWINYLLCAALLISYLAPVINPAKSWFVAFFGLGYPFILLANVLLIIYWFFRKRVYMAISVITIVVGYNVLFNNIGFRFKSEGKAAENSMRLLTYNVHNFKPYGQENDSATRHDILKMLADQQADVITFQEFFTRKRGKYALTDSLKKLMKSSHYFFKPIHSSPQEDIGMAIFSKYPVVNTGSITFTTQNTDNQCIYADLNYKGKTFRVYNIHLQSVRFGPEDYRYLDTVSQKGKASMTASRRLGGKLKAAFIKRSEQVFKVKEHASACPHPYIIMGDFNDTPTSFAVSSMAKGLKNAFREKGSGLGRTYNGNFPNYQIDYILASPQFDIAGYRIIEKKLSDHYPLYSDVVLN
ncbi:endonuclease/exonuclease/phosphatase family protein [Mucilaginibacter sp. JRF]|uniref:endonuclease/exonuclease/phosphatase family protein n=1 Tax=Mucilaginibacter sp. JRF TaxID=2780088 RepID=UPI001880919E|nr:endonuclease/exonuclease/phosphatase family protein [Mucilaginibacter sp. JRF]MBE9584996.1 endonuclease/exonuclease/phosphatase family protein [Mucilaginibacter sp. JRF]